MEDDQNKISFIQRIYDSNGKYIKEWKKFLFEIKMQDSQICKEIKAKLEKSLNDKNNIDLTCDIIDFIIDYGSESMIDLLIEKIFFDKFLGLLKKTTNSPKEIQKKVIFLLQKWKLKYEKIPKYSLVEKYYEYLKKMDIRFPNSNYKIETYDKYISEEEIKQAFIKINEIIIEQQKYNELVKAFMNETRTTIMNPFLEPEEYLTNLPPPIPPNSFNDLIFNKSKNYRTPEHNIDNNTKYKPKINILFENDDNIISKKISFNEIEKSNHLNAEEKSIDKDCNKPKNDYNINDDNNEKINIINYNETNAKIKYDICNKESIKNSSIHYFKEAIDKDNSTDSSINNSNKIKFPNNFNNSNNSSNSDHNSINNNIENSKINNNQNNNININKNPSFLNQTNQNKNPSLNNNLKINNMNSKNNNNYIKSSPNNFEQSSNHNDFNVDIYKLKVGNILLKINKEIDNRRLNKYLHDDIKGIMNEISNCESRINENLNNSKITDNLKLLRMDIIQTCSRYQCLIYKQPVPDFLSSFSGNNNQYNFNRNDILNFQSYNMNNNFCNNNIINNYNNYNNYNFNNYNNNIF